MKYFLLHLFVMIPLQGVTIGSDTVVTRFNSSQALANGDIVAGFAQLAAGFSISNSSASVFWNCFFPVIGTAAFNGGTLVLNEDLIFYDVSSISSLGNIGGQNHVLQFSPQMTCIPTAGVLRNVAFADIQIFLTDDLTLKDTQITFTGSSTFNGQGNTLTLASTVTLVVGVNGSLSFNDITIKGLNASKITALDNTATFSFNNTQLVLSGDYTFSRGTIEILNNLMISGDGNAFIYRSPNVSTIRGGLLNSSDSCSPRYAGSLIVDSGVTFSYDVTSSSTLLQMQNSEASIQLQSGTLGVNSSLSLTKGRLMVDGKSSLSSVSSIIFGDSTSSANNLSIEIKPAASLNVLRGSLIYRNI